MDDDKALEHLNRSGYPFQFAVEHAVRESVKNHGWKVLASEMPWSGGYVDLLLRNGRMTAVIECKRVRDAAWYFLVPAGADDATNARLSWFSTRKAQWQMKDGFERQVAAAEFYFGEASPESKYCVIPRDKESAVREIESACQMVVRAAHELADFRSVNHEHPEEVFIPVLLTTAELRACTFDSASLDLVSGDLSKVETRRVDFIRFRKPFSSGLESLAEVVDIRTLLATLSAWGTRSGTCRV